MHPPAGAVSQRDGDPADRATAARLSGLRSCFVSLSTIPPAATRVQVFGLSLTSYPISDPSELMPHPYCTPHLPGNTTLPDLSAGMSDLPQDLIARLCADLERFRQETERLERELLEAEAEVAKLEAAYRAQADPDAGKGKN